MHRPQILSLPEQVTCIALVAITVLGVASGLIRRGAREARGEANVAADIEQTGRVFAQTGPQTVSAVHLYNAYNANEIAADEQYKGHRLLVTGTVASIDKTFFDSPQLQLATPDGLDMAIALLERSEASAAATLEKGEPVRLLCTGHGKHLGFISLGDCVFSREPFPPPRAGRPPSAGL